MENEGSGFLGCGWWALVRQGRGGMMVGRGRRELAVHERLRS